MKGEKQPYVLAVNDVTNKVYVTNTYSDVVTVIDGTTNTAHALKAGSADGIAIDSRNNTIFLMTYEDPNIRVIDGATGTIRKVAVGTHLWGMILDTATNTLYLGHTGTANLVAMDEKPTLCAHSGGSHPLCCCGESTDSSDLRGELR